MKAYGHKKRRPVDCCAGHTMWAVQTKHSPHGPRFDRDASRRPYKKVERFRARLEISKLL